MWEPRDWSSVVAAIGTVRETVNIDFKNGAALGSPREVAKDIAAMTILGGTIAYGIDEVDEVASGIAPVALACQVNRVQQIADSAVWPPAAVEIIPIDDPTSSAGEGVLIVLVAESPSAPHLANDRFPARSGTTTRYLSEPEIEALYARRRELRQQSGAINVLTSFIGPPGPFSLEEPDNVGTMLFACRPLGGPLVPSSYDLRKDLQSAAKRAGDAVAAILKSANPLVLREARGTWVPRETSGWMTEGGTADEINTALARDRAAASCTYMYANGFHIQLSIPLMWSGKKCAYEDAWAEELIASLALAGQFFVRDLAASRVACGVGLRGLSGAVPGPARWGVSAEVPDSFYTEQSVFGSSALSVDPRDAAGALLARLFASFLPGTDVIASL